MNRPILNGKTHFSSIAFSNNFVNPIFLLIISGTIGCVCMLQHMIYKQESSNWFTLTRAILAGITGTSPLANPITKMCAAQFNNFMLSFVSLPPTGSYKTSTPFSFLVFKNAFVLSITLSLLKSTT
ncbi:hypothetical protein Hanom_Chr05g00421941 [Helianthus anomalus]